MLVKWRSLELQLAVRLSEPARSADDAVLFIHGLGCAKECFDGAWDCGIAEQVTLVAVDLPGFGASARPADFTYALEDHAAVVAQLLAGLPAERVHVVAHSLGGAVALLLLRTAQAQRIVSFINVEGNLVGEDCGLLSRPAAAVSFEHFQQLLPVLQQAVRSSPDPGMQALAGWLARADAWAFWRSAASLVSWSDSGELLDIFLGLAELRRLYVYGASSPVSVLDRLPGIECVAVPGSGHFVMQAAPEVFWPLVRRVIAGGSG